MIQKDSASTPWEYKKFSELMASVKSDLHMYDDANLIDDDRYIKVIMKCNEKLGERIHQSRTCKLIVKNYAAPIPEDMWKIENMYGISAQSLTREYLTGIMGATQLVFHNEDEIVESSGPNERIYSLGSFDIDDKTMSISKIDRNYIERVENKVAFPLILSNNVINACVEYSPCNQWNGHYQVDMTDQEFKFSFREGEIILTYLGAVVNQDGEMMYPFHPLLNDYYEYSIKAKILEDLFLNSDADVVNKLQYAKDEASKARYDAHMFIQSAKANQWSKMRKKYELDFYRKWYQAFDND